MRIAFLGPAPPFRGGISNFAAHLADAMAGEGHTVMYFNFIQQYPAFLFPSAGQESGINPTHPAIRVLTPYNPFSWPLTVKALKHWQPDLLIVSWWLPFFAPAYRYILKRMDCPKYILAHNVLPHESWPGTKRALKGVFRLADRIVVLSRACYMDIQRSLGSAYLDKTLQGFHPIYDGVAVEPGADVSQPYAANLLFFGLIKDYKGLDILLKAMPLVLKEIPAARLIVAGSVYGKAEPYHSLIQDLGLQAHVETHFRYLEDAEVAKLFAQSEVCILPYKSATQSGVIATAFSYNTPVIASDVGGLGEYIEAGRTGFLVPPNDAQALAAAIIRFYREAHHLPMRKAIASEKAKYNWPALARLILS